jgi:hypothetical protein
MARRAAEAAASEPAPVALRYSVGMTSDEEIKDYVLTCEDMRDMVSSIGACGFFLVATRDEPEFTKMIIRKNRQHALDSYGSISAASYLECMVESFGFQFIKAEVIGANVVEVWLNR